MQKRNSVSPKEDINVRMVKNEDKNKLIAIDNVHNKRIQVNEHHQQSMAKSASDRDWMQTLERRLRSSGENIEYEIKEEKEYADTPKGMSYYMCKKIIRPKIIESKQVDILNLENEDTNVEHRLFERKKISAKPYAKKSLNLTFDDIEQDDETKNQFIVKNNQNLQTKQILTTDKVQNSKIEKNFTNFNRNNLHLITKGPQSIFSIAYNGVKSRENISSESDKSLYNFEY